MTQPTQLKTFLWFDGNLAEALDFYAKTFTDFKLHSSGNPEANGKLMTADFAIHGHEFIGMGWPGGPKFNDAISLSLNVDGQDEVDRLWDAITKDGEEGQCGWCKDKWGLSWQITPIAMSRFGERELRDAVLRVAQHRLVVDGERLARVLGDGLAGTDRVEVTATKSFVWAGGTRRMVGRCGDRGARGTSWFFPAAAWSFDW